MKKLSPLNQNRLKEIVLHYVQGEALEVIEARLKHQVQILNAKALSLFKAIPLEEKDPFVSAMFENLALNKEAQANLLKCYDNLHELLLSLYRDGHHEFNWLLTCIQKTNPSASPLPLIAGGLVSLGAGSLVYQQGLLSSLPAMIKPFAMSISASLAKVFSQFKNIPLVGIAFYGADLLFNLRATLSSERKSAAQKAVSLLVTILASGFTLAGLTLSYLAGGLLTPTMAALILAGGLTGLGKNLGSLLFSQRLRKSAVVGTENWQTIAENRRLANWKERAFARVMVKLAAVSIDDLALTLWCLYPPTLLLTAGSLSLLALTATLQQLAFAGLDRHYAVNLQASLSAIDLAPEATLCPSAHPTAIKLNRIQEAQDLRQLHLAQQEKNLCAREQAICETLIAVEKGVSSPAKALLGLGGSKKILPSHSANEEMDDDGSQRPAPLPAPLKLIEDTQTESVYQEEERQQIYQQ